MFIGHFGVAFAAKRVSPAVSIGTLFFAAQFADLLWPNLVLLGLERVEIEPGATAVTPLDFASYPYSHSLLGLAIWGALIGGVHFLYRRSRVAALALWGLVISHWLLDWVVHRPDLPLTFAGETRLGLGLWDSVAATLAVEVPLFLAGVWLYVRSTRAHDSIGSWGLWSLVGVLLAIYVVNITGPPPPSTAAVSWAAQGMWLFVLWGFWVDRHRRAIVPFREAR
jgi:hypothetical protein